MTEKLDVYELRDRLMKVAEKEAKKRPDISKEELKKKLSQHIVDSKIGERALQGDLKKHVELVIGAVTELAVKVLELYFREKESLGIKAPAPKKAPAKKPARKAAKKK
jgi:hypothetical protein